MTHIPPKKYGLELVWVLLLTFTFFITANSFLHSEKNDVKRQNLNKFYITKAPPMANIREKDEEKERERERER